MENIHLVYPEIFISLSIMLILMIGVFIRKSFNLVFNLSSVIIVITLVMILNLPTKPEKIFLDSFVRDNFSNFFKILIRY